MRSVCVSVYEDGGASETRFSAPTVSLPGRRGRASEAQGIGFKGRELASNEPSKISNSTAFAFRAHYTHVHCDFMM